MSPRLFDRLAGTASVLILIALGMTSYYFAQKAEKGVQAPPVAGRPDPDYFVEKMSLMRADETGAPSVRVEAEHMRHFPLDQRIVFSNPLIISLDENQPLTTVNAREGSAFDTGDVAELRRDVVVLRAGDDTNPALRLTTPAATINLATRVITTTEPVQMQAGDNQLEGVGMVLEEKGQRLLLQSRVRGQFQPRADEAGTATTPTPDAKKPEPPRSSG